MNNANDFLDKLKLQGSSTVIDINHFAISGSHSDGAFDCGDHCGGANDCGGGVDCGGDWE